MTSDELTHLTRLLPRGRDNATSISALAEVWAYQRPWDFPTERQIREGLEQLLTERRVPVCTEPRPNGVYIAVTPAECEQADKNLRSRAMAILRRRRALRLAGERLEYVETLF